MKKNELRISKTLIGQYLFSLWILKTYPYNDWLITGATGKTKVKAFLSLIKWLYRYGNLNELLYIRSIKYEQTKRH